MSRGIKKEIDGSSFARSTLSGIIRKGFVRVDELDKTKLMDLTRQVAGKLTVDLLFVRDKWLCFGLDTKTKTIYKINDCQLRQYVDYFIIKNNDWSVVEVDEKTHPADIHARTSGVSKVAVDNGFIL